MADRRIRVSLSEQRLELLEGDDLLASYPVSTAAKGAGEERGTERTPRGRHEIRAKIGAGEPTGAVFVERRPTGEICTSEMVAAQPDRDWILTRILWLGGLEAGRNLDGRVDTMQRYIYIHGTPDPEPMGEPRSHGCIRMRNDDVEELFDLVESGTIVEIVE